MQIEATTEKSSRVESIDYLRGLAACGIVIYHMQLLNFGEVDASSVLSKLKIYGVAIFYVVSGLTLFVVYSRTFEFNREDFIRFYLKRFFRIFPLLWLVTLITFLLGFDNGYPSLQNIVLNITVLPGIVRPYGFAANGAWSIGNELFFYLFFPLLLWVIKRRPALTFLLQTAIFACFAFFSFRLLLRNMTLSRQWATYVNPLNQLFYFSSGMLLGLLPKFRIKRLFSLLLLAVLMASIVLYPVSGNAIELASGINRLFFSVCVIAICYLFFVIDFSFLPGWFKQTLKFFGEISYSLYLLHPVVFVLLRQITRYFTVIPTGVLIALTVFLSIFTSYIVFNFFEKYFIKLGKAIILRRRLTTA